jgi:hypothetical protein
MAHLHFRRTVYKAGSSKAAARIEYITGQKITEQDKADRQLRYIKEGREDLITEGTRNLPAWAEGNPHTYFRAAEQYERASVNNVQRRGVAFEEWKITLPQELSRAQNQALIDDLLDTIAGDRLPCTYAFHAPTTIDGRQEQPHIHLLISGRITDGHARTPAQHFKRWNSKQPERGGAQKDVRMNHQGAVKAHRLMISDMLNVHLELNGQVARVHPDTLESRGIQRAPEPKLLPSESAAYREKGEVSPTMAEVLRIREARAQDPPAEQNQARQYWEQRKAFLGLTRDMSKADKVGRIVALRHGTKAPTPQRSPSRQHRVELSAAELDKRWRTPILGNQRSKIYHLPTHKNYGEVGPHHQVHFWTERAAINAGYRRARNEYGIGASTPLEASPQARVRDRQSPMRSMSQDLQALASRLEGEEVAMGKRLRVRLHDEERAQEHGLGF